MKTFYLKILVAITILLSIYLSIDNYNRYTQTKNFQIINERQSVIVQLPNTEYLEITSRNDHIDNRLDFLEKPFSSNTKIQKNSNLENSIAKTNIHTEYTENGDTNSRLIRLKPVDNQSMKIEIYANTQYIYKENLRYNVQLDYSNKVDFKSDSNKITYIDKGCTVTVVGDGIEYSISENKQSLILSKKYEPEVILKFDLNINCKK
ncbi:MAG: hypothetical protein AB9915_03665 [Candidatus Dojkabacteria bacterium]